MQLESCRATKATRVPGGEAMVIGLEGRPQGCKVDVNFTLNSENCNADSCTTWVSVQLIPGRLNSNSQRTSLSLITTRMPVTWPEETFCKRSRVACR